MSDVASGLTPFQPVNTVLEALLAGARVVLGNSFSGLYLYGSLATGDFKPERSDIDFLVVTKSEVDARLFSNLESMHRRLAAVEGTWAKKLEGVYLPKWMLRHYDPDHPAVPTLNEGRFYWGKQGVDWVIQRHVLREYDGEVFGPSLRGFIDPVTPEELKAAVRGTLRDWWLPMLEEPSRLEAPEYQPFAVLSMCRALFTLEHDKVVSKDDAARWAAQNLEPEWVPLIQHAVAWRRGDPYESRARTVEFMRHILRRAMVLRLDKQPRAKRRAQRGGS